MFGSGEASFDGFVADDLAIESLAVVFDGNTNVTALMFGSKCYCADFRFIDSEALFGCFDAMVGGVAKDVNEWVSELFENAFVDFGFLAFDLQIDFFD